MVRNVVLITIDSLRSDFVGHLGGDNGLTPNIDGLADDGLTCTQAYANGIPTYFAFRSILGGRCDIQSDPPIGIPTEWQTIADVFSTQEYNTAAFNAANPWLTAEFNYDSGFDTFIDFGMDDTDAGAGGFLVDMMQAAQHRLPEEGLVRDKLGLAARTFCSFTDNYPIKSAEAVTVKALEWLSGLTFEKPFFLWIHYMDPHYPWTPTSSDISRWEIAKTWHNVSHIYNNSNQRPSLSTINNVCRLYSNEVSNVDTSIGKLLTCLERQELRDETIICITADHGTELGDHGGFSHGPDSLYEEVVHVPLVMSSPDVEQKTINDPVQHIDIPILLMEAANVDTAIPEITVGWAGQDVMRHQRDSALIQVIEGYNPAVDSSADRGVLNAIIDYPWKLHWNETSDRTELYNLETDPDETENLSKEQLEKVKALKHEIHSKQEDVQRHHQTASEILAVRRKANDIKLP